MAAERDVVLWIEMITLPCSKRIDSRKHSIEDSFVDGKELPDFAENRQDYHNL